MIIILIDFSNFFLYNEKEGLCLWGRKREDGYWEDWESLEGWKRWGLWRELRG